MVYLLLAPYNDSIRLGQGFNSFLHKPCIDGAVTIPEDVLQPQAVRAGGTGNVSQTVSYSSRFVDKISDVVRSMNISAASSIKSGTIEVSGNSLSVDEAKFAASDLNAVISVKVVNQTMTPSKNLTFNPLKDVNMDSQQFFNIFGDCYVSGFMEGGDLHGIVSIKVLDSSKKSEVESFLKGQINASGASGDFILGEGSGVSSVNSTLSETETTVTVNWSGGGLIKPDDEEWTLDSLLKAAAAFPSNVAKCPQRTWAILTRYNNNRSFMKWAAGENIVVPDFNRAQQITSDLLDDFMEYKHNLSRLQAVMANPSAYEESTYPNAVKTDIAALVKERKALKGEMSTISKVIDCLNLKPMDPLDCEIESPIIWACRLPKRKDTSTTEGSALSPIKISELIQGLPLVDEPIPSVVPPVSQAATSAISDVTNSSTNLAKDLAASQLSEIYAGKPTRELSPKEAAWVSSNENNHTYKNLRFDRPLGCTNHSAFNDAVSFKEIANTKIWPSGVKFQMVSRANHLFLATTAVVYEDPVMRLEQGSCDPKLEAQNGWQSLGTKPGGGLTRVIIGSSRNTEGQEGITFIEGRSSVSQMFVGDKASDEIREYTCPDGYNGLKGWWGERGPNFITRLGPIWGRIQ
ncbi:hypothetical protein E0Z10_g5809 [Xylaria hypoxylon]|uniref:Uncharacterized protein n=1 Tax=Xylaria hypoxylon TaxID=37992 RepID=A0A4Z0YWW4_9PEZI|nr:hypothetical protein E0Z10_g5809 [Xylaria hypoxylon]